MLAVEATPNARASGDVRESLSHLTERGLMMGNQHTEQRFQALLQSFGTAILVTESLNGKLRARPMTLADIDTDVTVYFLTSTRDGKVEELKQSSDCVVTMADGRTFLSITAEAELCEDRSRIRELWNPLYQSFFPDGPESETVVLFKVRGSEAEYWDTSGLSGIKYLMKAGVAYLQGERPKMSESMHSAVDL